MILTILYEDNHLIAVDKPRGIPTQSDASGDPDMMTLVKEHLKEKHGKPGDAYLGLIHRLDRPVGGVLLFAKTSKAAARITAAWQRDEVEKRYLTIARGLPVPAEGRLEHWLLKNTDRNLVSVCAPDTLGAKRALLEYRTLATRDGLSLLAVTLLTGRSHQIRVQLAAIGHPVVGEEKYGPKSGAPLSLLSLHAVSLRFDHPVRREPLQICSRPPLLGPWSRFTDHIASFYE